MSLILNNIGRKVSRNWIIRNLNLRVENGQCLALLGPSGCGKSTTLRLIAGLDKPSEGSIILNDKDITSISPVDRKVGMVFQSYALFPHLSIAENLLLGLKIRGINLPEQQRRVSNILSLMQLEGYANRKPSDLSGGQRQRVALARALLREPMIYLLDEPMSNLDAQLREELRTELRRLILNKDKPVVYVTHDQHEAMAMANRIAVLRNGELEQIGSPEDLYHKPSSLFVATFIGRPQINQLTNENKIIKAIRPENIYLDDSGLECKLIYREWLGNNQLWLLNSPKGNLRMLCDASLSVPERIQISWSKNHEHLFNKYDGKRIY